MKVEEIFNKIFKNKKKEAEKIRKRLIMILTVFFIIIFFCLLVVLPITIYQYLYQEKVYSGVFIDGINLGGLTQSQAIDRLNKNIDNLKEKGLNFYYQDKKLRVEMTTMSPIDPDLSYQLLAFDPDLMVRQAYSWGRGQDFFSNLQNQLRAVFNQKEIKLNYALKTAELKDILKQNFQEFENPGQDAQIVFSPDGSFIIEKEKSGYVIDYDKAINNLKNNINLISINSIELKMIPTLPEVIQGEAEKLIPEITDILKQEKLILKYKDKSWEIKKDEFKNWLGFKKEEGLVKLIFKTDLLTQKLQAIAGEINVAPQDAKFTLTDSKVTEFKPSLPGLELDLEQSLVKINQEFFIDKKTEIEILVKESAPAVKTEDVNNLGIKELIGTGVSDFSGSHTNRIKNIKNAVAHLNGILIKPGEFSLVEAIGPVDASTGYFPEFVIKGDRTIPEYGGGLCQIGTTTFRVALYSGLPITERRPHSYIVSYYKPIGMDATIYGPHPDLKFINDTGNYLLLQIKIEGTKLIFELWGTSDGRKVEITDPVLYNWTSQPADRLIENPDLKPGEKKLMEKGRSGADAHFYRYLTMPGQEKKEEIWRSHYVAWPNIYEVGVSPTPAEPTTSENGATSSASSESGSTGNQNINSQ